MSFVKVLSILRNFFGLLRSEKSFPIVKMVSQKVSYEISFHRERLCRTSFSMVGNQTFFLRNLGFVSLSLPQVVLQKVSRPISFHRGKWLVNWFLRSFLDRALIYRGAKLVRGQNGWRNSVPCKEWIDRSGGWQEDVKLDSKGNYPTESL